MSVVVVVYIVYLYMKDKWYVSTVLLSYAYVWSSDNCTLAICQVCARDNVIYLCKSVYAFLQVYAAGYWVDQTSIFMW